MASNFAPTTPSRGVVSEKILFGPDAPYDRRHYNWGLIIPLALLALFWLAVAYLLADLL